MTLSLSIVDPKYCIVLHNFDPDWNATFHKKWPEPVLHRRRIEKAEEKAKVVAVTGTVVGGHT